MKKYSLLFLTIWQVILCSCTLQNSTTQFAINGKNPSTKNRNGTTSGNKLKTPSKCDSIIETLNLHFSNNNRKYKEIRCLLSTYRDHPKRLLVFRKANSTNNWKCYAITYCSNAKVEEVASKWKELKVTPDTWQNLKSWKIETLQDEQVARKRWKSTHKIVALISHGAYYKFEIKRKGKLLHQYGYSNPFDEMEDWNVDNAELVNVTNIITLLEKEFNFTNNDLDCN